jgi:SAM-dependent methyltransferase
MTPAILEWLARVRPLIPRPGRVLEVGSLDVCGNPRSLFPDAESYVGLDLVAGPNVDRVGDAHDLRTYFGLASFDTILCCEMLEHDLAPWLTIRQFRWVLRPGGHLIVTSPANGFPEHRYPVDCFRFLEDAYRRWIFDGFEILDFHRTVDPCLCCIGQRK